MVSPLRCQHLAYVTHSTFPQTLNQRLVRCVQYSPEEVSRLLARGAEIRDIRVRNFSPRSSDTRGVTQINFIQANLYILQIQIPCPGIFITPSRPPRRSNKINNITHRCPRIVLFVYRPFGYNFLRYCLGKKRQGDSSTMPRRRSPLSNDTVSPGGSWHVASGRSLAKSPHPTSVHGRS